ncbi:MAG: hypothetical protein HYX84_04555 [Chloroflexi bacterium]|nr:hypothetical protein [Chloroflexota bacterium]
MKKWLSILLVILLSVSVATSLISTDALAHERRDVGKYQVVVGFIAEPAIEGQKNGVDLRVTSNVSGESKPVEGVEETLQVEITHVATGVSRVFSLRTIFRDPGHYTTDLILTAPGVFRMRFFGNIEGTPVNETFNSRGGGGGFNDVESSADIQFPQKLAEVREVEGAARGALSAAQQAQDAAKGANTLATIGIVLGGLGLIVGASSLLGGRRRSGR